MTFPYAALAAELFNTPLLGHPDKVAVLAQFMAGRQGLTAEVVNRPPEPQAMTVITETGAVHGWGEPYEVIRGAAIIPVRGSLINNSGSMQSSSGNLGYDSVRARLRVAMADPMVRGIWMPFDSYGGQVAGCFPTANEIRGASKRSGGKPIWACVNEHAYSAGYALASQADVVVGSSTAGVGSIGCVIAHADYSKALEEDGIKVTLVQAGARKTDGNPYQPLPEAVFNRLQAECEKVRQIFADTVGLAGRITATKALATEAACYTGSDALAAGLIDAVLDPQQAFEAFLNEIGG
jgi:ClpP class serine protease